MLSQGDDDDLTMNVVEDDAAEINKSHSWAVWRWFSVFTDLLIIFSAITAMARLVRNEVKDVCVPILEADLISSQSPYHSFAQFHFASI